MLAIAHRGASGYAPENTISAFNKALSLNADIIELDVRRCKTGELVVIHDALLNRVTNGKGKVRKKTLKELQSLTVRDQEKIPTLSEVLDFVKGKAKIDINVKDSLAILPTAEMIKKYITHYGWKESDIILSSTHLRLLFTVKRKYPMVHIAPMIIFWPAFLAMVCALFSPAVLKFPKSLITPDIIRFAHRWHIPVYVWTVNEKEEIEYMKKFAIDGVITNYPDFVK